jgi:hypothetical protein
MRKIIMPENDDPDDDGTDEGTEATGSGGSGGGSGGEGGRTYTQADLDKAIEKRLARERKKYADYDDLKAKATEADASRKANQTLEERIEEMQREQAERDAAAVSEKADTAVEKLHAKLVRGGFSDDDATALTETIDPLRLLDDGKPSTEEINKVAKTLTKIGKRSQSDPDQGARGGAPATSMNDMIRQAAGRNRVS